jgi:hypothetical protein
MFFIWFDLMMSVITFLLGLYFYKSNGRAANLLSGYNIRSSEERKKYNETEMCKSYGKRMMVMSTPFLAGCAIDWFFPGIGCAIAWILWIILLILLIRERVKREK